MNSPAESRQRINRGGACVKQYTKAPMHSPHSTAQTKNKHWLHDRATNPASQAPTTAPSAKIGDVLPSAKVVAYTRDNTTPARCKNTHIASGLTSQLHPRKKEPLRESREPRQLHSKYPREEHESAERVQPILERIPHAHHRQRLVLVAKTKRTAKGRWMRRDWRKLANHKIHRRGG